VLSAKILSIHGRVIDILAETKDLKAQTAGMEIKETATEVKIELSGDVLFDFDKWDIRPVAEPALTQVSDLIAQHPGAKVSIVGYTDSKGADDYNHRLSEQRALAVKNWLTSKSGKSTQAFSTKGLGEAAPVAPNSNPDGSDNPEGRQKNRRVEITVKKG
jgi:outer membrane protein OmpA-like peptidoglycan-associated protein